MRLARLTASNFFAETHPSLPNYIAMTSGSPQGITDDNPPSSHPLNAPSIFSQLPGSWRCCRSRCRYAVGWTVRHRENSLVAKDLIAQVCEQQQITRDQLTVHADRGSSMTSKPVAFLLLNVSHELGRGGAVLWFDGTRAARRASQRGVLVGHHQAQGPREVDVLRSVCRGIPQPR